MIGIMQAIRERHSVRQYKDDPIPDDIRAKLSAEVDRQNKAGGLSMQLFFDEPSCFDSPMSRYGKFENVRNYLAIVGPKGDSLEEKAGYYGEKIVLLAQRLGLNSCWVAVTHGKSQAVVNKGEKEVILVALGYGKTQGVPHESKPMNALCEVAVEMPDWFKVGMDAAMLSPTAMNQQKFLISYDGMHLDAQVKGRGFFTKTDLGIVKCDFEIASGHSFRRV